LSAISNPKRDSITILADILKSLTGSSASRKMSIVYKANLNFVRIRKYLDILIATGMIEEILANGYSSYRITDRGREFLFGYERLKDSLKMPAIPNQADPVLA
jgi:predicted transcriptional regulator